jgi:endonuclease YncB( thermonuclease family)
MTAGRLLLVGALLVAGFALPHATAGAADHDCGNFSTQAAAQGYFDGAGYGPSFDPERLDADHDGLACESNRCPCASPQARPAPTTTSGPTTTETTPLTSDSAPAPATPPQAAPLPAAPSPEITITAFTAKVYAVVDGDTIKVRTTTGQRLTVRLLGIDTPETKKPGVAVECGGKEAAALMRKLALNRTVSVRSDPTQDAKDRYGRTLGYVDRGSSDVGVRMVEAGWSSAYVYGGKPPQRYGDYVAAAQSAKEFRLGVWARCGGKFHSRR